MAELALPILRSVDDLLAWANLQPERFELVHGSNLKVRLPDRASMYSPAFVRCGPNRGDVRVGA